MTAASPHAIPATVPRLLDKRGKRELVVRLIGYMLYPQTTSGSGRNKDARNQARFHAVEVARELAGIERRHVSIARMPKADKRRLLELLPIFWASRGFGILVSAPSKRFYDRKKVAEVWSEWCTVFRVADCLYRGRGGSGVGSVSTPLSLNRARWIAFVRRDAWEHPLAKNYDRVVDAERRFGAVAHLVTAAMWVIEPKKPIRLRDLERILVERLDEFLGAAVELQNFLIDRSRGSRDVGLGRTEALLRMPKSWASKNSLTPKLGLSEPDQKSLQHYSSIRLKHLNTANYCRTPPGE